MSSAVSKEIPIVFPGTPNSEDFFRLLSSPLILGIFSSFGLILLIFAIELLNKNKRIKELNEKIKTLSSFKKQLKK